MSCNKCRDVNSTKLFVSGKQYCRSCYFDNLIDLVIKADIKKDTQQRKRTPDCGPGCYCVKGK